MKLPLLAPRQGALDKCVYCPKLCRAACPVSNAEPNESLTPWGKMSAAAFLGRGQLELTHESAEVAWACTGCYACRERCDHKNPVADTLLDARAELFERALEPAAARRSVERAPVRAAEVDAARARIGEAAAKGRTAAPSGPPIALLLGCGYARHAAPEGARAVRVLEALTGRAVALAEGCCGFPALAAGDRAGFARDAGALAAKTTELVVLDPGCAKTLIDHGDKTGAAPVRVELFVDVAFRSLSTLPRLPDAFRTQLPRYHDPCQLGRGLGRYAEPRALLEQVLGTAPREFERNRGEADCSGGGGLLPVTRPAASRAAAELRGAQHTGASLPPGAAAVAGADGPIVTACAASLKRFRSAGLAAEDIVTYLARALGVDDVEDVGVRGLREPPR